MFQTRSESLDELTILLPVFTFHDHDQVVLQREFFFEAEEILMVLLVGAHEVIPAHVELKILHRVVHAEGRDHQLGIDEPARMPVNRSGQPVEQARG